MQSASVQKSGLFLIVFLLLSACGPASPPVPPPAVTVSPPAAEQEGASFAANCPAGSSYSDDILQVSYDWQLFGGFRAEQVPMAGNVPAHWEYTLASRVHKFCFAYPPGFTWDPNNPLHLEGPARGEGWEKRAARLNIQVEGLAQDDQRSLQERVSEYLDPFSFADPSAGVRQSLTLGGVPAEMVELPTYSPPGAPEGFQPPTYRMLFTVHGGRFYTLTLDITPLIWVREATAVVNGTALVIQIEPSETPSEAEIAQSQADFEAIYQAIVATFTFLP